MILIEDRSTDDTLKIVEQFQTTDSRIKYKVLEKNSGTAIARNEGLRMAKGR